MITVVLADDHLIVRKGLCALLHLQDDIEVVGEAANGHEAVALAIKLHPDVVVMDITMPLMNGMDATREVRKATPATHVLMHSAHNEDAYIERALELGASGYMLKQSAANDLPVAIRSVHKGKLFLSPAISKGRNCPEKKSLSADDGG